MQDPLRRILDGLTAERLRTLILDLAKLRPAGDHSGVPLPAIMDSLTEGLDLGAGSKGWRAELKLRTAIIDRVAMIPGMEYVEGDS